MSKYILLSNRNGPKDFNLTGNGKTLKGAIYLPLKITCVRYTFCFPPLLVFCELRPYIPFSQYLCTGFDNMYNYLLERTSQVRARRFRYVDLPADL